MLWKILKEKGKGKDILGESPEYIDRHFEGRSQRGSFFNQTFHTAILKFGMRAVQRGLKH